MLRIAPLVLLALLVVAALFVTPIRSAADDSSSPSPPPAKPETPPVKTAPNPSLVSSKPRYSASNFDVTPLARETVAELAKKLDPEQFRVTQQSGTEAAFCGNLVDNKKDGTYVCVVCGLPLFASSHKFNSGTGWPSFFQPFDKAHVTEKQDRDHGMVRTEINCARCTSHLGHVFDDGPRPTGLRFCLNSASLRFFEKGETLPEASRPIETKTAFFAGGCFWGIEHWFQQGPGVISAESGYMQGVAEKPSYEQVCTGNTKHAETVKVVYDPKRVTYRRLLEAFFAIHDPTQLNRQGPDVGDQYRSGIWCSDDDQLKEAAAFVAELKAKSVFGGKTIVTQIEKAKPFFSAEEYHQDYVERTGRACHGKNPW